MNRSLRALTHDLGMAARALGANLVAGWRYACARRAEPAMQVATPGQLLLLLGMLATIAVLDDLASAGWPADFSIWGCATWLAQNHLWLLGFALIAALARDTGVFLRLAVAMAAVLVVQHTAWIVFDRLAENLSADPYTRYRTATWYAFLAWEFLVFFRIARSVCCIRLRPAALYTAVYATTVYLCVTFLPYNPIFTQRWSGPSWDTVDIEAAYYAQPQLLAQDIHALSPERPGVPDVYFIGFAGYGEQDVFRREVEQATLVVEQQFHAIGRTLKLINNRGTVHTVPLANRHNLDRAVRAMGERLNPDEDVLVVFLTSHGNDDATIAVDMDAFAFNDIDAASVRDILDEHAIKWRVVIVSACFSGSFIRELRSPNTLVITAAAADRSSFGCSHENDWTYFGEAYFDRALRQDASFAGAFDIARAHINDREQAEGKTASEPQMAAGEAITAYLHAQGL